MRDLGQGKKYVVCVSLVFAALLAGCGGGGSSDESPEEITLPLQVAVENFVNAAKSTAFTASGKMTQNSIELVFTGEGVLSESMSKGFFEGKDALIKNTSTIGEVRAQNIILPMESFSRQYYDEDYNPLAELSQDRYCRVATLNAIPESAPVGTTNIWYTQTCYTDSSMFFYIGDMEVIYAVESYAAGSFTLRVVSNFYEAATGTKYPTVSRFRVTEAGEVFRVSESGYLNYQSILLEISYVFN